MITQVKGNLLTMALDGHFDIICHGCNTQNVMGAGIAPQIDKVFNVNNAAPASINRLGGIELFERKLENGRPLMVVNMFTQFYAGVAMPPYDIPFDYDAFSLCLRKLTIYYRELKRRRPHKNEISKKWDIAFPHIGCGLAGGYINRVYHILNNELPEDLFNVYLIEYDNT